MKNRTLLSVILRRSSTLLLVLMMALSGQAKDKIVERSASKMPQWVGVATAEYIAVSATAPTMDEAQHKCMADIRQQIITSVAVNIASSESYQTLQLSKNELIDVFEKYSSDVQSTGASLPFITGISLSKAKEIYWERHYVKSEKRYYYAYHILYPFSEIERNRWIAEFLEQDEAQYDKYLRLKKEFESVPDVVESIATAIGELSTLKNYFFDSRRKGEVSQLMNDYYQLYNQITIQPIREELGSVLFCLAIGDVIVTSNKAPRIKSKSAATGLSVKMTEDEGVCLLTYDYSNCYEEDDNSIELSYSIGGKAIKRIFYFDVTENKVKVAPTGVVNIFLLNGEDGAANRMKFEIMLKSSYENEFEVKYMTLNVPEYNKPVSGNLGDKFKGKGNHLLVFTYSNSELHKNMVENSRLSLLDGTVDICNLKTGVVNAVPFKLPYRIKR